MGAGRSCVGGLQSSGSRLLVEVFQKPDRSAEKGVVTIARHHVRRTGDIGELRVRKLRNEDFRSFPRDEFA